MTNKVSEGGILVLAAPYAVAGGAGALVGSIFGVAMQTLENGAVGSFAVEGVYDLTKASGGVTAGAKMYWDNSAKNVTTTSSGNTLIGCATQAQQSGDATCRIRLGIVA